MLYVATLTMKSGLTEEHRRAGLGRRANYQFPAGIKWKAEYWPIGPVQVICIFEAESFEAILHLQLDWQDLFDIAVYPAATAEEGLKAGGRILGAG